MLVLKLELWPHGNANAAREIGRVTIINIGGSERIGDYAVALTDDTGERRQATVSGHPRAAKVWWLVAKALYKLGFELVQPGDISVSVVVGEKDGAQ